MQTQTAIKRATPVPRKMTLAGGYKLDTIGMPAKPSGRTGVDGDLLKPEMADAEYEAQRLMFELAHSHATVGEELHGQRYVVAEERIKAMMMRLDDLRRYVQTLAKQNLKPHVCPRCQAEPTDDPSGDRMCPPCITSAFSKVPR